MQKFFYFFVFLFVLFLLAKILRVRAAIFEKEFCDFVASFFKKKADFVRMFRPVGASRLATSGAVGCLRHLALDGCKLYYF